MLLKEEASNFLLWDFSKMKFFSSLLLKNFSCHLTWNLTWMPFHKMVSIISMNMNKTKLPAKAMESQTKYIVDKSAINIYQ